MPRTDLWSNSVPRAELDQRSREARLRIERLERLFAPRAARTHPRFRQLLFSLVKAGFYRGAAQGRRTRGSLSRRRPPRMPPILDLWRSREALP